MDDADNIDDSHESQLSLDTFIGNARAVEILKRAIEQDRLPHAMIFAGPAGVGKCTLALLVAQYLNCLSPADRRRLRHLCGLQRIMAMIESRHLQVPELKEKDFAAPVRIAKSGRNAIRIFG